MYKVFLNNKTISFQRNSTVIKDSDSITHIEIPISQTIELLHTWSKNIDQQDILLLYDDPNLVFQTICKTLGIIDAGGGIVHNQQNDILFIFRRERWDLPKGKLDTGETIDACALREVQEECGISNIKITNPIGFTYHLFTPKSKNHLVVKRTMWYNMEFFGTEIPVAQAEEGITDIKWFSKKDINIPLTNTYALVKDLILKL